MNHYLHNSLKGIGFRLTKKHVDNKLTVERPGKRMLNQYRSNERDRANDCKNHLHY